MATVNEKFQSAPMSGRVTHQVVFGFVALFLGFAWSACAAYLVHSKHPNSAAWGWSVSAPFIALLLAVPQVLRERATVARFRIENNCLVLGKETFPMAGIVDVSRDPEVLSRARRIAGGGLRGIRRFGFGGGNRPGKLASVQGTFQSKRLGKFYAFLTGTDKAVVLRWPDKAVAVSPADPEFFILMARSAAGLR